MLGKLFTYAILIVYATVTAQNWDDVETLKGRLPDATEPVEYWLQIVPDLNDGVFRGQVTVKIKINSDTKRIVLHAHELNVTRVKVSTVDTVLDTSYKLLDNSELPVVVIDTIQLLQPDLSYNLTVEFAGKFQLRPSPFRGYYRITHEDDQQDSAGRYAAVTHFEPTEARRVFPCYDEPTFKTPFTISIAKHKEEKVRSNMPQVHESMPDLAINNRTWVTFQRTLPMPTYLVAFVTFQYGYLPSKDRKIHVWGRREAMFEAVFALHWADRLLKHMEAYIGMPYSLPKLDLVAIRGFPGAMENWGLMIFGEKFLLCDEHACSQNDAISVVETVAHEISHQWFGNLVTMDWWSRLWLKEAFATYFQYYLVKGAMSTWPADELFIVDSLHSAFKYDYYEHITHPMTNKVVYPKEIRTMYDVISYKKGASVLRMISHVVGQSTFQKALRLFVSNGYKAGGTVTTDSFWTALEGQLKEDQVELNLPVAISLPDLMTALDRWTTTASYPVIRVTSRSTSENRSDIIIDQGILNCTGSEWLVPLTKAKKSEPSFHTTSPFFWSATNKAVELRDEVANDEWILFNVQQTGYYRVNYDDRLWKLLIEQLNDSPERIHVINRAQLLDDAYTLALIKVLDYNIPLMLTKYLENEREMLPWLVAINSFQSWLPELTGESRDNFINLFAGALKHQYDRIGFSRQETDDTLTRIGREKILEIACEFNVGDCVQQAKDEYEQHRDDLKEVDPDLKYVVFCTMLRSDEITVFDELWRLYAEVIKRCHKLVILKAFSCLQPTKDNIKKLLGIFTSDEGEDYLANKQNRILTELCRNPEAIIAALEVINEERKTRDKLRQRNLVRLVNSLRNSGVRLGEHLQTITKLEHDVRSFDEKNNPYLVRALQQLKSYAAKSRQHQQIDVTRINEFFRKSWNTK